MNTQFDIPQPLIKALTKVSHRLHKTETEVLIQALQEYLEDQEDLLDAEESYEKWLKDEKRTFSFEEVMEECGLSEKDLDA
jgi:predicted DNA-binding protein